jgi:predicted aspartyl protease
MHTCSLLNLSRRTLLGQGAASVAVASGALAADRPAEMPGRVPAVLGPDHLGIDVKINGRGPFCFVVDTGADRTILAADVAASLGLQRGRPVMVQGIIRSVVADTASVNELAFGSVTTDSLNLPILPRSLLEADGYLGLDVIDGYRVVFDFKRQAMEIGEARSIYSYSVNRPGVARIPASGYQGHLRAIDCRVDGVSTATFIDTGAEVSVGNTALLGALAGNNPAYIGTRTLTLSGVTGGSIEGRVTHVDNIRLHGITFSGCDLAIADLQIFRIWGLTERPALLMGLNFLRDLSSVSIDYGRKEFRIDFAGLRLARRT